MHLFGNFHDCCIKEIRYASGAYVDKELSMYPINSTRIVDVVFQRQAFNPMAIVLRFIGLVALHLAPCNESYTCEIHGATMFRDDNCLYWADSCGLENGITNYGGTWICANALQWHIIDESIGNGAVFQADFDALGAGGNHY